MNPCSGRLQPKNFLYIHASTTADMEENDPGSKDEIRLWRVWRTTRQMLFDRVAKSNISLCNALTP